VLGRTGRISPLSTRPPPACSFAFYTTSHTLNLKNLRFSSKYVVAILVVCLTVCCSKGSGRSTKPAVAATRELVDESGKHVRLPVHPQRIVSLAPSLTETVFAVGAGDHLVGDTTYCDYPEAARHVAKVGDTMTPNIEAIIGLKPDVVLVSTASQLEVFTRQMEERQIAVYVSDPRNLDGVLQSITNVGEVTGNGAQAAELVSALRNRISGVTAKLVGTKPVRVFYQVSAEPLYTAGRDAFITDLIARAGGGSVSADVPGAWPRLSNEAALASRPDAIVIPTGDSMGNAGNRDVAAALRRSPAALSGRIYAINGDLLSRPGPRIVDGLEELAKDLHPEVFK
jgi:iron complex transport system substrate-binding protein